MFFQFLIRSFSGCVRSHPRCFPTSLTFDPSILGAALINMESGRCLSTFSPSPGTETLSTLSAGNCNCHL